MQANGFVSGEFLIGWFILQNAALALKKFMEEEFEGTLTEQHEQNLCFAIPRCRTQPAVGECDQQIKSERVGTSRRSSSDWRPNEMR
eukprot:COSAG02_NODE_3625_length_6453_cov_4.201448_3_plen_87_part_00